MAPLAASFTGFPALAAHPWAYPALEVVHIVGIALLLGNLTLLELRIWGAARALPVAPLARLSLTLVMLGFALIGASGLLMFASQPAELLSNRAFLAKLGIIALAGVNAAAFHARGGVRLGDLTARLQTALSLGLWLGAIICGRWIAYL